MKYKIDKPKKTVYFLEKSKTVAKMSFKDTTDFCLMLLNDLDLSKGGM